MCAFTDRNVCIEAAFVDEFLSTCGAFEFPSICVLDEVAFEVDVTREALAADTARVWKDSAMHVHVNLPAELSGKRLIAD